MGNGIRKATRYEGVYVRQGSKGQKVYDIAYTRSGKKIWEKVGSEEEGYSLQDALTIRGIRLKEIRHGEALPRDRRSIPTFGQIAERFLEWSKATKKSWKDDQTRYKSYLQEFFEHKQVDMITPLDIERVKVQMAKEGKAPGTIRQGLALFRAVFNKGISWNLIHCQNPMLKVRMPKVDNARERFLSNEEISLLLRELKARSPQAHSLTLLALNTGARLSELTGITWSDVDLRNRTVTFRGTKNGKTRRIPLNDQAHALLASMGQTGPKERVFQSTVGTRIINITKTFKRLVDEMFNSQLDKKDRRHRVVFHTLRHTAASHMVMNGVPLGTVKEILGHSSLAMVDRYAHLSEASIRLAVSSLATSQNMGI